MRITALLAALFISSLAAQPVGSRLARLIPPDSSFVYSINLERYADSALQALYPIEGEGSGLCLHQPQRITVAERASGERLAILSGCLPSDQTKLTVLEAGTAIFGDSANVEAAIQRWRHSGDSGASSLEAKVRRLVERYDNWMIAVRPLHTEAEDPVTAPRRSYRSQVMDAVEEVRGGIRLGSVNQVEVEVTMKTVEDAMAAAGLGRWLRGFVQSARGGSEAVVAEVAEGLNVTAVGNTVLLSFLIDSAKLLALVEEQRAKDEVHER